MIESEKYLIHTQIDVDSPNSNLSGLVTQFSEEIQQAKQHTFIVPSFEYQEFFVDHEGTFTRVHVKPDEVQSQNFKQTSIASFGSQYFAVAVVDRSNIIPEFQASVLADSSSGKNVSVGLGGLVYQNSGQNKNLQVKYTAFAGPKSYDLLKSIDANLTRIIDFGFFTSIAKAIFWLMKSIYSYLGNWGIAIILLTIIIRMIVLPFNLIGYKQMKAMTKLQPQIKLLKEKYKNDSQKLNQEMITLMKEAKANPLGGCLPMLVQIPVFFALYQVIGHSIELYHAPFFLWIHDLSLKDPYFVLPILMALTMYIQQKITPSTLEPAQQKIMNFLPIIFSLLMLSLPSGLTLYLFISSVFGVVQQFYFTRENHVQS